MTAEHTSAPRVRWTLQTRLIVWVVGLVSGILIVVGLATGTIIGGILQENLDTSVNSAAANLPPVGPGSTAAEVLSAGPQEAGTLLAMRTFVNVSGAYISDGGVTALTSEQLDSLLSQLDQRGWDTVTVPGLGEYRVRIVGDAGGVFAVLGLPTSEVTSTITQIVTTVALVTTGGLLLLAAVIAVIIRRSLRPLRAVADTATRVAALPLAEGEVSISERVPESEADENTEIGQVGAALNTLLDHVGTSLSARQRNEERMRAFVADASHELRTPLASIRGYSELSLKGLATTGADDALAGATRQSLERIQAQSLRMTSLVEDLLLLARLDEGTELVVGTVDLSQLAIEAVGDARAAGPDHQWRLVLGEEPVIVAGDVQRLHQVAANLLANARVHTPAGTTVTVSVEQYGADAILRVHDDGPGIDPAIADELFERFSRGDRSRARKTGGTGLGLSIARAIVDAHRGAITVDSEPGSTLFAVRLPARPAAPGGGDEAPGA